MVQIYIYISVPEEYKDVEDIVSLPDSHTVYERVSLL